MIDMFLCFLFLDGDFGGTVIPRRGGGGGTPLEGLIGDVRPARVCFLGFLS